MLCRQLKPTNVNSRQCGYAAVKLARQFFDLGVNSS
jgi:hypothetical protein